MCMYFVCNVGIALILLTHRVGQPAGGQAALGNAGKVGRREWRCCQEHGSRNPARVRGELHLPVGVRLPAARAMLSLTGGIAHFAPRATGVLH